MGKRPSLTGEVIEGIASPATRHSSSIRLEKSLTKIDATRATKRRLSGHHQAMATRSLATPTNDDRAKVLQRDREPAELAAAGMTAASAPPQFDRSTNSNLHYGTRIALETLNGQLLMMSHDLVKERILGRNHSFMTSKALKDRHPSDVFVFRVIDLKNPESKRPVKWGDTIWLQIGPLYETQHNEVSGKVVGAKVDQAYGLPQETKSKFHTQKRRSFL